MAGSAASATNPRRLLAVRGLAATAGAVLASAVAHLVVYRLAFAPEAIAQNVVGLTSGGVASFFIERLGHWAQPLLVVGLSAGYALSGAVIAQAVPRRLADARWVWAVLPVPLWMVSVAVSSTPPPFFPRFGFAVASLPVFLAGGYGGGLLVGRISTPGFTAPAGGTDVRPESPLDPRVTRRSLLAALAVGGAGVALGSSGLAARLAGASDTGSARLRTAHVVRPTSRPSSAADAAFDRIEGLTPEITPTGEFYVVDKDILNPVLVASRWRLRVHGLVERPLELSFDELRAMRAVERYQTLECISNKVGGHLLSTGLFTGIPLGEILGRAGIRSAARTAVFRSAGGYSESHPIDRAIDPTTLVVLGLNGHELPRAHGYPARLLTVGTYGMKNPKWLTDVELVDGGYRGYWEVRGWAPSQDPKITARIDVPDTVVPLGRPSTVAGIAFAGDRGISRVQVSVDGGRAWDDATLKSPLSPYTWRLWRFEWRPARAGSYRIVARAFDGDRRPQVERRVDAFPSGATGLHSVTVPVA